MKRCTLCGGRFELALFNKKVSSPDGHQNVCRECNRAQARRYYANNRAKHLAIVMERTKRSRVVAQDYVGEYLSTHPCVDCSEADVRVDGDA
ncbi:hypothetical protein ACFOYW_02925 [Gryllotalpicola reticulitermitis]|uniref:HNH endonuclease n=1 Tax=Gryllotalpicola reticulitermitis TaxID=1184153 RepID=A0ABV8Q2Y1_9MICO